MRQTMQRIMRGMVLGFLVHGALGAVVAWAAPPGPSRTPPSAHPGVQRRQHMEQTQMRLEQQMNRPGMQHDSGLRAREQQEQRRLNAHQHMDRSTLDTSIPSRGNPRVRGQAAGAAAHEQQGREQGRHIQRSQQRPEHQPMPVPRQEPRYETIPQQGGHQP